MTDSQIISRTIRIPQYTVIQPSPDKYWLNISILETNSHFPRFMSVPLAVNIDLIQRSKLTKASE